MIFHVFTFITVLLFFSVYLTGRTRLLNTLLFFLMYAAIVGSLGYEALEKNHLMARIIFLLLTIPLLTLLALGAVLYFFILLYFILNGFKLWRKEGRALHNSLSLGFALLLLADGIIYGYLPTTKLPLWFDSLLTLGNSFLLYSSFIFFCFYFTSVLYRLYRPAYNKDFILVLGSGLIDGERVPPLLASRIQRALTFRAKQLRRTKKEAILIFSGGQGADEKVSEAYAMRHYALAKGLPPTAALLEDQSRTTEENLQNSKKIMEQQAPSGYQAAFSTNNFHVLRAAIYARRQHLKIDGLSAKTAFYFLPNAFTREYIAYLVMYKGFHLTMLALLALAVLGNFLFTYFFS